MEIETVLSEAAAPVRRSPAAWVKGTAIVPFGLALGFSMTALPFLLTRQGVPLGRVAGISAAVISPTVYGFLLKPLLDTGLSRKFYSWALTLIAAVCLATGVAMLTPGHLYFAAPALLVANLSMVLYSGAVNGWVSHITEDGERGKVAGWMNVANLGAGAMGSFVVMTVLTRTHISQSLLGLGVGAVVLAGATPLLFFPDPQPPQFRFKEVFSSTFKAIWKSVKRRECLVGFALLLTPAAGSAAQNLMSGLGRPFHTPESTVVWVTGIGSALVGALGALIGGRLADRFPRGYLYLVAGLGTATTSFAAVLLPHTAAVFIGVVLVYNLITGVIYSAYNALGLELTGTSAVASTQLGLFAASINANVTYMTKFDGMGFAHGGIAGLFLVDGCTSLLFIVPLLFLVRYERRRAGMQAEQAV